MRQTPEESPSHPARSFAPYPRQQESRGRTSGPDGRILAWPLDAAGNAQKTSREDIRRFGPAHGYLDGRLRFGAAHDTEHSVGAADSPENSGSVFRAAKAGQKDPPAPVRTSCGPKQPLARSRPQSSRYAPSADTGKGGSRAEILPQSRIAAEGRNEQQTHPPAAEQKPGYCPFRMRACTKSSVHVHGRNSVFHVEQPAGVGHSTTGTRLYFRLGTAKEHSDGKQNPEETEETQSRICRPFSVQGVKRIRDMFHVEHTIPAGDPETQSRTPEPPVSMKDPV